MTIAEAAQQVGVSVHTIRYYERAGLLLTSIERNGSGHRRFSSEDVDWIVLCTRLRSTGMPIRRIHEYAELVRAGAGNEAERLDLLETHRADVIAQLSDARQNLRMIDAKIARYRDDVAG